MPATCSTCHHSTNRYTQRRDPRTLQWTATCHVCSTPRISGGCLNPFSTLILDHARDETGQPLEISSLRQLRRAESKFKFRSVVANSAEKDFDTPPQTHIPDLYEQMTTENKWLYPEVAQRMVDDMKESGEI